MTYALIPNFSVPLPYPADFESVPFHADPILAAIDRHNEAWSVFQVAPSGEPLQRAESELDVSLTTMLGTACATRPGAFALLRHLRWWLDEEAANAETYGDVWCVAKAREADLTLLLGCDGVQRIPVALPSGRLASAPVQHFPPKRIVIEGEPVRPTLLSRLGRIASSAGEHLSGFLLVGGGCVLIGISTRL